MRKASLTRKSSETEITVRLNLDGSGQSKMETGVGFFDHMLAQVARHGFLDLEITAKGDVHVDCHHTIEDIGIVLGKCIGQTLGDKTSIKRYGSVMLPMEEALTLCALDISGRPYLVFDGQFTTDRLGDMDTEMVEEFFRSICIHGGLNLHIKVLAGKNNHHIAESMFKAFGKALSEAVAMDERIKGALSTKGMLEA